MVRVLLVIACLLTVSSASPEVRGFPYPHSQTRTWSSDTGDATDDDVDIVRHSRSEPTHGYPLAVILSALDEISEGGEVQGMLQHIMDGVLQRDRREKPSSPETDTDPYDERLNTLDSDISVDEAETAEATSSPCNSAAAGCSTTTTDRPTGWTLPPWFPQRTTTTIPNTPPTTTTPSTTPPTTTSRPHPPRPSKCRFCECWEKCRQRRFYWGICLCGKCHCYY